MQAFQHTVSGPLSFSGVGLHTGARTSATILPAGPGNGIVFRRKATGTVIPATVEHVAETAYATVLSAEGVKISTVEHFLAALYGMEVDNAVVEGDGTEMPILDGSALGIAGAIASAGVGARDVRGRFFRVWGGGR